jgi:ATP-binding cassette subfamily C protein
VRKRGGVVVVITHRPAALGNVDLVGIMEAGRIKSIGPRDEVLKTVMRKPLAAPVPATASGGAAAPAPAPHLREVRS